VAGLPCPVLGRQRVTAVNSSAACGRPCVGTRAYFVHIEATTVNRLSDFFSHVVNWSELIGGLNISSLYPVDIVRERSKQELAPL